VEKSSERGGRKRRQKRERRPLRTPPMNKLNHVCSSRSQLDAGCVRLAYVHDAEMGKRTRVHRRQAPAATGTGSAGNPLGSEPASRHSTYPPVTQLTLPSLNLPPAEARPAPF